MDFSGKIALVTGSSSGIGAAIAQELAAGGANVALHYRSNPDGVEQVADAIRNQGGQCRIFKADVSNAADQLGREHDLPQRATQRARPRPVPRARHQPVTAPRSRPARKLAGWAPVSCAWPA